MKKAVLILFVISLGFICYYLNPEEALPQNIHIDKLVVLKSKRLLQAYSKGDLVKSYKISLGGNPKLVIKYVKMTIKHQKASIS